MSCGEKPMAQHPTTRLGKRNASPSDAQGPARNSLHSASPVRLALWRIPDYQRLRLKEDHRNLDEVKIQYALNDISRLLKWSIHISKTLCTSWTARRTFASGVRCGSLIRPFLVLSSVLGHNRWAFPGGSIDLQLVHPNSSRVVEHLQ
jgi:hypothetical protein